MIRLELKGSQFGGLSVIGPAGNDRHGNSLWECRCQCGKTITTKGHSLTSGKTRSCGCLQRESARKRATHGHCAGGTETPEYRTWSGMHDRCGNPRHSGYKNYGGRGIAVCDQWSSFETFLADMGRKPSPKHTIDRIDNDGPYEPGNCRWATKRQQSLNQRPRGNKSSRYVGVHFDDDSGMWKAQVRISLGRYTTEEEAKEQIDHFLDSQRNGMPFHWPEQVP